MTKELSNFGDNAVATMHANVTAPEITSIEGHYHVVCRDKDGNVKWEEGFPNLVVSAGKQLLMVTLLRGSSYTVVGPFLGLTKATWTFTAADTMTTVVTTNSGEFTNYTVLVASTPTAVRGTAVFAASTSSGSTPSNVTTSAATSITYTITGAGGTIYGCFLVTGSGAVSTQSSTAGTLYSVGNFASSKVVTAGDTVAVTYSATATS
jgi:hypothetical protein